MAGIDPDFKKKRKVVDSHNGHSVWGPIELPKKLGIHGDNVCVDLDLCIACGTCVEVCPVGVFEFIDTPNHPTSNKKADPIHQERCIACLACEVACPTQAIKIFIEE